MMMMMMMMTLINMQIYEIVIVLVILVASSFIDSVQTAFLESSCIHKVRGSFHVISSFQFKKNHRGILCTQRMKS